MVDTCGLCVPCSVEESQLIAMAAAHMGRRLLFRLYQLAMTVIEYRLGVLRMSEHCHRLEPAENEDVRLVPDCSKDAQ